MEDFPDIKSGYKITFSFKDNPFFNNQRLVKELHYADDNALAVKGTDIEWTEAGVSLLHWMHLYRMCVLRCLVRTWWALSGNSCNLVHSASFAQDSRSNFACPVLERCNVMQLQHQEQAQQELTNGRKRKAEDSTSFFDWFWDSGDIPEGNEPISDLIKDELWTNPMRGSGDDVQVHFRLTCCYAQCTPPTYSVFKHT